MTTTLEQEKKPRTVRYTGRLNYFVTESHKAMLIKRMKHRKQRISDYLREREHRIIAVEKQYGITIN